jgi:hypothetical protein
MQLRDARLCLDCEEVHDAQACPVCGSETFAYLSRWVPAPDGGRRPRPASSAEAEIYRQLLDRPPRPPAHRRFLKRGLIGLTAIGIVGWAWRSQKHDATETTRDDERE